MGTEKLSGIVIREQAKGESNKQIVLLAKGVGRVVLSARGARKTNSRLLAATQLFCYADFVVYEGNGFYSINQAELQKSFYDLRTDVERFSEAVYLTELVDRSCPAGMEQDEVLVLLYRAFSVMEKGILPPKLVSRIFELKLLQLNGLFAPEECQVCAKTEGNLYFDPRTAVFYCAAHRTEGSILVYDAVRQALQYVLEREGGAVFGFHLSEEAMEQLTMLLKSYMEIHMGLRLKSRDFFEQ
ncbi:MAG: DNA repair protein RecO [Bacillota bacterium]|nr:DNA repair protein RecO [Bacillota bacterium]